MVSGAFAVLVACVSKLNAVSLGVCFIFWVVIPNHLQAQDGVEINGHNPENWLTSGIN